jgi:hypothetical protein
MGDNELETTQSSGAGGAVGAEDAAQISGAFRLQHSR